MNSYKPEKHRSASAAGFDPDRKFVRVRVQRLDHFIEFDFAIGEPEIFVEMILHADAFDDFCAMNKVVFLTDDAPDNELRLSRTSGGQFK